MKRLLLLSMLLVRASWAQPGPLTQANHQFASDLHRQLAEKKGNLFYSPFSISTALAMTAAGARGETAREMLESLHAGKTEPSRWKELLGQLKGNSLRLANRLWVHREFELSSHFAQLLSDNYEAGAQRLDFTNPELARSTINQWVSQATEKKIPKLIPAGMLNQRTRLVLTNAIYFKAEWQNAFPPGATHTEPFTSSDGQKSNAPLMHAEGQYGFANIGTTQVLDLPYKGGGLALTIVLPKNGGELARLEKAGNLNRYLGAAQQWQSVRVSLPRFKVESSFQLIPVLRELGMRRVFDPGRCDLTGMGRATDRLFVSQVLHKAVIEVNEKGSEAAAATAVTVEIEGRAAHPEPIEFRADHAFIFAIRDRKTGLVLFMGRLDRPK